MRRFFLLLLFAFQYLPSFSQPKWRPAHTPLTTPWTDKVSPENALPEYPRPTMVRKDWLNLNGVWDLVMLDNKNDRAIFTGKILVPFPVESALSGVGKKVEPDYLLSYRRFFILPESWKGQRILLHFGAVDYKTEVFVNGKKAGEHLGGYDPFSFDITEFLTPGGQQHELSVQVTDPTDTGGQPVGKQRLEPSGIWYTATSGIWQTVWLEPVPTSYIRYFRVEPDLDKERIIVRVEPEGGQAAGLKVSARIIEEGRIQAESSGKPGTPLLLSVKDPHPWSPDDPYLYDLEIVLTDASAKTTDKVTSYFGMRKISLGKGAEGFTRLMLNNKPVFQLGPLDQGFWPDGIYTPPSEEAMINDLQALKDMGFNMIRKHVKVEAQRWYYLCDKMGFLVWQDMPSAGNETTEDRQQFKWELQAMVDALFNHPSIVMWVPFNEGWGQHDTEFYVERIKAWDPTRLVNNASGWTDTGAGDVADIHAYPGPAAPMPEENRATVLGEFGGLGFNVAGHQWERTGWGYELTGSPEELLQRYEDLYRKLLPLVDTAGLSAAVYTQLSDVETENNGLLTYDRKVTKLDPGLLRLAHEGYLPPMPPASARIFPGKTAVRLACVKPGAEIFYTLDETTPRDQWAKYTAPIPLKKSATIHCRAVWSDGKQSHSESYTFKKVKAIGSKKPKKPQPGLLVKVYEGSRDSLPDFSQLQPATELTVQSFDLVQFQKEEDFALLFTGWIEVPETAAYTFFVSSDDGSRLFIVNQLIADNNGLHGLKEASGSIALKKGRHPLRLEYFQKKGGKGLTVEWEDGNGRRGGIPVGMVGH